MLIFSIINSALSLAEGVINAKNLGIPGNYADIFEMLKQNKIISDGLCGEMKTLIKLQNLLAHEYETFDERQIAKLSAKVYYVKEFVKIAAAIK